MELPRLQALAEGISSFNKDALTGMTKAEVTKHLSEIGFKSMKIPGGQAPDEAAYTNTSGGFPAYLYITFTHDGKFRNVKAS